MTWEPEENVADGDIQEFWTRETEGDQLKAGMVVFALVDEKWKRATILKIPSPRDLLAGREDQPLTLDDQTIEIHWDLVLKNLFMAQGRKLKDFKLTWEQQ